MNGPTPPLPAREPLHTIVAGWLEKAFNPIMVKELRASFRGNRFFVAHLTILSIFACGLLLTFAGEMSVDRGRRGEWSGDPSRVGRSVYLITQLLNLAVVFLVVPGLAATSISGERERLTHELLISTTMSARQIVWGKFTAAMTQTFMIFASMVPLVGLCFLFGGITVYQIVANYLFLFALSALVIAFALTISASSRTTQRAVGTVYGLVILASFFVTGLAVNFERSGFLGEVGVAYGFISRGADLRSYSGSMFERVMYIHVMPGFAWIALLALFFASATNRLKPIFANRSTSIRAIYLLTTLGAGLLTILTLYHELPPTGIGPLTPGHRETLHTEERSVAVMCFALCALTLSLLSALFACEDPILPPHLQAEVSAFRGPRRFLRLFWPGATSGAFFSLAFHAVFLGLSFAALVPFSAGFDRGGVWSGRPFFIPTAVAFGIALVWAWFTAMYARFLGITLASRPVLLRTLLVLSCLILAIFPIVHWAIATSIDRSESDILSRNGPVTLGLSAAAAIVSALDLSPRPQGFPVTAGGIPLPALFAVLAIGAGTVLLILGNRSEARLLAEYRKSQDDPPGE
jgi:ABC-type transport system involved in multi-copper enzyme maturation permease subunit